MKLLPFTHGPRSPSIVGCLCALSVMACHRSEPQVPEAPPHFALHLTVVGRATPGFEAVPVAELKLGQNPILRDGDLVSYDWADHVLHLKPGLRAQLSERFNRETVVPFVVLADGERCYQGAFLTWISSYLPPVPVIEISGPGETKDSIKISPPPFQRPGESPKEVRNDPRVKDALRHAGLLRDEDGERSPPLAGPPGKNGR